MGDAFYNPERYERYNNFSISCTYYLQIGSTKKGNENVQIISCPHSLNSGEFANLNVFIGLMNFFIK